MCSGHLQSNRAQGEKAYVPVTFYQIGQGDNMCVPVIFNQKEAKGKRVYFLSPLLKKERKSVCSFIKSDGLKGVKCHMFSKNRTKK